MDFRRIFDIFPYQQFRYPQKIALSCKKELKWQPFSTEQCIQEIHKVSAGFLDLRLKRGDKVAAIAVSGTPHWNFLDFGVLQIGGVIVPIHPTISIAELTFIFNDAQIKYCVVANQKLYQKVDQIRKYVPSLKKVFSLEKSPDIPHWEDLISQPLAEHMAEFEGLKAAIHEDDLALIVYTSGTTGNPKGVMLSHKNIISNLKAVISIIPVNCDKTAISFLPVSHIFERIALYTYIAVGASVFYTERLDTALENMKTIKPHYFTSVPLLIEKVYSEIIARSKKMGFLRRKLLEWSIKMGKQYNGKTNVSPWLLTKLAIADLLVYRKWRKTLGGRIEGVVVGAAALQPELGRLFSAAGIQIREGYGLTEASPVVSFNRFEPGGVRFGTVGIPLPGVKAEIDHPNENGEGEILVKGPNVMMGYYNNPTLTSSVITPDGWLKTGDIGKFVEKRFLKITGRKKDIFKTASGKFIAPQSLEQKLQKSPLIHQCIVIGYNRPFVATLIVPDFDRLKEWCVQNNVHWTAPQFMVINPKVIKFFQRIIDNLNHKLPNYQKIHKFRLLYQTWTVDKKELTPTHKLKREVIIQKHQKTITEIYST